MVDRMNRMVRIEETGFSEIEGKGAQGSAERVGDE
jgi:hypothetical protein